MPRLGEAGSRGPGPRGARVRVKRLQLRLGQAGARDTRGAWDARAYYKRAAAAGPPQTAAASGPTAPQASPRPAVRKPERSTAGHPGVPGRRVMRWCGRRRAGAHRLGVAPLPPLLVWGAIRYQEETKFV